MTFSTSVRGLPSIRSFFDAKRYHDRIKAWRGEGDAEKPLDKNRALRHKKIIRYHNGAYAMRLHGTDVVTYYADNSIEINPWSSMSTNAFFNCVSPGAMHAQFTSSLGFLLWCHGRGYLIKSGTKMRRGDDDQWTFDETTPPENIRVPKLDKRGASKLLKDLQYDDYKDYASARWAIELEHPHRDDYCSKYEIAQAMRDRDYNTVYQKLNVDFDMLRFKLYEEADVYHVTELEFLEDYKHEQAVRGAIARAPFIPTLYR